MAPLDLRQRTILALLVLFVLLLGFKASRLNFTPDMLIPVSGYKVEINMTLACGEGEIRVISALPAGNFRQSVFDQTENAAAFDFSSYSENGNRFGSWQASQVPGMHKLCYGFSVKTQKVAYQLPDSLPYFATYGDTLFGFLKAPNPEQPSGATIKNVLNELQLGKSSNLLDEVRRAYDFVVQAVPAPHFADTVNAGTPWPDGAVDFSDKNDLFVALLRELGVPARLVGGLILSAGNIAIVHHWSEAFLGNQWVDFDPEHQQYAVLPANYLKFQHGGRAFFQHTDNARFDYEVSYARCLFPRENDFDTLATSAYSIMQVWPYFERAGVPLDLLRMIIMIPLGALITIIFRNVIGVETFGTFLPVLIASAFRETGLLWGLLVFVALILSGAALGAALHRLRILYAPRLTIVLVYVVAALFLVTIFSMKFANVSLGHAALFPLAVMAITIERFALLAEETGTRKALALLANTVITVIFCYGVIHSVFLQTIVLAFPETMLLVIGASIYLGAWRGLRLSELLRFRRLIFSK